MRRDAALALGAGLIGGGLALLFDRMLAPADTPPTPIALALAIIQPARALPPLPSLRYEYRPAPQDAAARQDHARRVRVLVYRIRRGELSLASPEVTPDVSADVADILEGGFCPPLPCGAADGALPLSW